MRCFRLMQNCGTAMMMFVFCCIVGMTSIPSIHMIRSVSNESIFSISIMFGLGLVLQNILHLWTCAVLSRVCSRCVQPGVHPLHSIATIGWGGATAFHRMCILILPAYLPTFVGQLYYEISGLQSGRNVNINSAYVNDAHLVSIGAGSVVGGCAFINCHIVEDGTLILAPIRIGINCTIGAGAFLNPGVELEDGATIASRAVVPKFTRIPKGEIWGGVPARFIRSSGKDRDCPSP